MKRTTFAACAALALTAMAVAACNRRMVYDRYVSTPISGWEKNDTLDFYVPPVDTGGVYQASIGLRTNDTYPFTAVTLIVEQRNVTQDITRTDTVHCQLADRRGNAAGKGISYHQYVFDVSNSSLHTGDSLHIRIRHDMKREILPGISDVGYTLVRE